MKLKLLIIPLLFILGVFTVSADELFLQDNVTDILEDVYIDQSNPDTNFGNFNLLLIGEDGGDRQTFIKFDLTQIPLGSVITKSELGLFEFIDATEGADTYDISEVDNQTWIETDVTFNSNVPIILDPIVSVSNPNPAVADGFIVFDVLSWVIRQTNLSKSSVSFHIDKGDDSGGADDTVSFHSKEFQTDSERPFLNITFLPALNTTNLDVFLSKNPVEILESFTLFANYTNTTDDQPVLNAFCFANSSLVGGGQAGFGRGVLGIGGLSTLNNAVHTQINDIFGNNTLRVDIKNIPLGKASYGVNFRFHAHNQTPTDALRVFATCHNNLTFSNFTLIGQVNATETVISTSTGNDTIWGFKNVVLFGASVASENCSIVFESQNTSIDKHWMIADTTTNLNLNNSFTSNDFGVSYTIRPNAFERSPFVDAGFGLDVPTETTMTFNATSGLYFLPNIRHGRPFDFIDRVFCSADNFVNATDFVITNVQDNVPPIVQITDISPTVAIINVSNVTIQWNVNDPELLTNFINVSFPNGSLVIQSETKPLILTPIELTVLGIYTVIAFANDTGGLFTIANGTFEVAIIDISPPVITLIFPDNNTATNLVPLDIVFSVTDNFPFNIICTLGNSTEQFDIGTFPQATNVNLTLAEGFIVIDQEFPNLELTCFDNSLPFNNSATLNLNYTLDTNPPVIIPISPLNQSSFNKQVISAIQLTATCSDVPVFSFNITVSNSSDIIAQFENTLPVGNTITIDEAVTISNLAIGTYDIDYSCFDTHTSQKLKGDWNIKKNTSENNYALKWVTDDGNEFEVSYDNKDYTVSSYGSQKNLDGDRYEFYFNINETDDGAERTFTFEVESRKQREVFYIQDSKYKAHFITGKNWLDFEFNDPDAIYIVTQNSKGNWEIEITTTQVNLNFYSAGALNEQTLFQQFTVTSTAQIDPAGVFSITECPLQNLQTTILFIFFILLSFIIMVIGFNFKVGVIGFMGGMLLLILSTLTYACFLALGIILSGLGILMIVFFISKGVRNFT